MVTITINNDFHAHITGDFHDDDELDARLSYTKGKFWFRSMAARYGRWDGKVHLYNKITRVFPVGLLHIVRRYLKLQGIAYTLVDCRSSERLRPARIDPSLGGGITLRPDQIRALNKILGPQDGSYLPETSERGIIHGSTSSGKTEIAISITKSLGMPTTLFLTGRKKLARQTRERFARRLNVAVDDIGFIQGGKWRKGRTGIYIAVVNTLAQPKFAVQRKELFSSCQLVICDEVHHGSSDLYYKLISNCRARYRYGLTGTPAGRSDGADLKIRACTGRILARIRSAYLVEKGILARPKIYFTKISKPLLVSAETWGQVYGMGIVDNDYRNGIIAQYAHDLDKAGLATLILVKELAHGKGLKERLEALGSKSRFVNGSTTDDMLDRRVGQFEAGTLNILIATSIFDEGVDIPAIRAIIMGTGGQSKISTLQRIGRGLRHKTGDNRVFIFDFFDDTHRFLRDHATKRLETCRAEDHETILLEKPGKIADLIR